MRDSASVSHSGRRASLDDCTMGSEPGALFWATVASLEKALADLRYDAQLGEPLQYLAVVWLVGVTKAEHLRRAAADPSPRATLGLQGGVDGGDIPEGVRAVWDAVLVVQRPETIRRALKPLLIQPAEVEADLGLGR